MAALALPATDAGEVGDARERERPRLAAGRDPDLVADRVVLGPRRGPVDHDLPGAGRPAAVVVMRNGVSRSAPGVLRVEAGPEVRARADGLAAGAHHLGGVR